MMCDKPILVTVKKRDMFHGHIHEHKRKREYRGRGRFHVETGKHKRYGHERDGIDGYEDVGKCEDGQP